MVCLTIKGLNKITYYTKKVLYYIVKILTWITFSDISFRRVSKWSKE